MQVGARNEEKIDVNFERRFLIIHALPAVRARILNIRAPKLGVKIEQKTIKKEINLGRHLGIDF